MFRSPSAALFVAALAAFAAVAATASAAEVTKVAVVDFAERGAVKGTDGGRIVAELIASRLKRLGGRFEVCERLELKRVVDELRISTADLFDNNDKAAQLGKLAKVHFLLVGSIGKLGNNHVVVARLVDVTTGKLHQAAEIVEPDLNAVPARLDELLSHMAIPPVRPAWMRRAGLVPVGDERDRRLGLPRLVEHQATGIRLVLIPPGELVMGSRLSTDECERRYGRPAHLYGREHPAHKVRITRPFYLGQHEVTNGQFRRVFPAHHSGTAHGLSLDADTQPVVRVTWHAAEAFCRRAAMRLPTEAEWEYACRAGRTSLYAWGDDPDDGIGHANVHDLASRSRGVAPWPSFGFRDGHVVSAPVGRFAPNRFGLHDMHGNAWEWCKDQFDRDSYRRLPLPHIDPCCTEPRERFGPVLRGGSWREGPDRTRCAYRHWATDRTVAPDRGFRVARDIPEQARRPK